jgi:hypothetical protein
MEYKLRLGVVKSEAKFIILEGVSKDNNAHPKQAIP